MFKTATFSPMSMRRTVPLRNCWSLYELYPTLSRLLTIEHAQYVLTEKLLELIGVVSHTEQGG